MTRKKTSKKTSKDIDQPKRKPGRPKGTKNPVKPGFITRTRDSKEKAASRSLVDPGRFAAAYLANGGNASAALRVCGHARPYLAQHAYAVTKRADVQAAIVAARNQMMASDFVTADKTVRELARVGLYDIKDLYDEDGNVLHPMNMPENIRHAIVSVEHTIIAEGVTSTKIRLHDKVSALDKLARHFGLFEADNRQKPINVIATILAEINPGRVDLLPQGGVTLDQKGGLLPDQEEKPGIRLLDSLRQG